jgi:hypothetical protein
MEWLLCFLSAIETDPRISTAHITLYVALWKKWMDSGSHGPLSFFRSDLCDLCKMGVNTFHKRLRELHAYGYVEYIPSHSNEKGSRVRLTMNLRLK